MTKARTKAQKRASKKQRIGVRNTLYPQFEAEIPAEGPAVVIKEDPRIVVLSSRCRHLGRPDTKAGRRSVSDQMAGDPAGQAIMLRFKSPELQARLWDVFKRLDRAHDGYHRRIIGKHRFPKVSRLEYLPERFETSADDALDARHPDEKDRAARAAWDEWAGHLRQMDPDDMRALMDGIWLHGPFLREMCLTMAGRQFADALLKLSELVQTD